MYTIVGSGLIVKPTKSEREAITTHFLFFYLLRVFVYFFLSPPPQVAHSQRSETLTVRSVKKSKRKSKDITVINLSLRLPSYVKEDLDSMPVIGGKTNNASTGGIDK
jgi:hypothetical protein